MHALAEQWRDEETKTSCPSCRGCGKHDIKCIRPGEYTYIVCSWCNGAGMVTATEAVQFRHRSGTRTKTI